MQQIKDSEKTIQEALRRMFENHKYILTNSYVFAWESDFFSVTDSGYIYEVEVKVSRSDFKSDFGKDKHKLFKTIAAGKRFMVENNVKHRFTPADLLHKVLVSDLYIRDSYRVNIDKTFTDAEDSFGYWQQRDQYVNLQPYWKEIRAAASPVRITDLQKRNLPNRFFYAVPIGLVQPHEVPQYAGLIYVDGHSVKVVKQAPFITKEPIFGRLHRLLLDKFYYLAASQRAEINYHRSIKQQ